MTTGLPIGLRRIHWADLPKEDRLARGDRVILWLVGAYFILKPFYFWSSGLPQPADFLLLASLLIWSLGGSTWNVPKSVKGFLGSLLAFGFYTALVNLVAMLLTSGSSVFIRSSLFVVFNVFSAIGIAMMHLQLGGHLRRTVLVSIILSALVQAMLVLAGSSDATFRETAQFNNPNQLAYYGLLSASLIIYLTPTVRLNIAPVLLGLCASAYLVLESLSKAGIISFVVLVVGILMAPLFARDVRSKRLGIYGSLIAVGLVLMIVFTDVLSETKMLEELGVRFGQRQADDSLANRGYLRIWNSPQYWFTGAGEGEYERLGESIELHSTLGSTLASYGLIGLLLFISIVVLALRSGGYWGLVVGFALLLHGLSHNGTRNTFLWIALALMATRLASNCFPGPVNLVPRSHGALDRNTMRPRIPGHMRNV